MKVLFTGTFRSGKSTMLDRLQEEDLEGVVFIPEVARRLLENNPD